MFMIVGLYIIIPILNRIVIHHDTAWYFVVVAFVVYLVAMGINSYVNRERCVEIEIAESSYDSPEPDLKEADPEDVPQKKSRKNCCC